MGLRRLIFLDYPTWNFKVFFLKGVMHSLWLSFYNYNKKIFFLGVKPFYCPINGCNKSFGRKDHLKKHIKTHEREYIHPGGHAGMSTMLPPTSLSLTAAAAAYSSPPLMNSCSYTAPPNSAAFLINSVSRLPRFLSWKIVL